MNKKAQMLFHRWPEYSAIGLAGIGFLLAALMKSAVLNYATITLIGMTSGRLWYKRKGKLNNAFVIVLAGFLIGYLIGTFLGNRAVVIGLFFVGHFVGHQIYEKKLVTW